MCQDANSNSLIKGIAVVPSVTRHLESLFIKIGKKEVHTNKDLILGCIYRPPDGDVKIFMESYVNILEYLTSNDCYICGDFNIDLR